MTGVRLGLEIGVTGLEITLEDNEGEDNEVDIAVTLGEDEAEADGNEAAEKSRSKAEEKA